MTHDPLCPSYGLCDCGCEYDAHCMCGFIAKVRADEREQTIHDCIAAVDGLSPWRKTDPDEVENALRGLRQP